LGGTLDFRQAIFTRINWIVNIARVNIEPLLGCLDFAPPGWHQRRPIEGKAMLTVHHLPAFQK
jgi:hypothetical protein